MSRGEGALHWGSSQVSQGSRWCGRPRERCNERHALWGQWGDQVALVNSAWEALGSVPKNHTGSCCVFLLHFSRAEVWRHVRAVCLLIPVGRGLWGAGECEQC